MRARAGNRKLLLSASASNPRVHFTELAQDNPKSPPMFCMLMRKHLTGAKLVDITQAGLERIRISTLKRQTSLATASY